MSRLLKRLGKAAPLAFALALVAMLALAPLGTVRAQDEELPEPENAEELAELSGEVLVDGSSTVYPPTQAAAEEFSAYAPEVQVTVGISGTGGGFERFCRGETDISNASRPIVPDEVALCEENGTIGREALAMSVSPRQKRSKPPPVPEKPTVT